MNRNGRLIKKMYLNRFGTTDMIDRTGAEALISDQVSREIIQGVAEQSTVLRMGKKLPNMSIVLNGVDMTKKKYGYYYGYGKYGKYGHYGRYGRYGKGSYGSYGSYGNYSKSHYGDANDDSVKH